MKKLVSTLALSVALVSTHAAQSDKFTTYDLNNSKLHVYQTGDAMGDVSFIVEGDKKLVILEQPLFWENVKEFTAYVESLKKPIDKVVANYHSLGLASYPAKAVVMPEAMIEFNASPMAQGMIEKFKKGFGDAADFRPYTKVMGFAVPSTQSWAGVEMIFTEGAKSDFPAASILIDGKAYYAHFAPSISHASKMQIRSAASVEMVLAELYNIKNSGAEYIFGSHGKPATQAEVEFQIGYYERAKSLRAECGDSDLFAQRLIAAYPTIAGVEGVGTVAKILYPHEPVCEAKEQVKERVQDYLTMVSNLDMQIAKGLWAKNSPISIITPRSHFFGFDNIMNDFLFKTFSSFKSRKLSTISEVVNVYDNSATVQLYWIFDTVDASGESHQTRGRESLIFEKESGEWRLVHVHYSRLPQ